jgi:outer membrane lipoprotein-sorting protein
MRKFVFLFVFMTLSSAAANAQVTMEILKRIEQHQKALKSLRAEIAINKFSVQAGGGYLKEGSLTLVPHKIGNYSLRLDSPRPEEQNFLIVANQYLVYLPNGKLAYTGKATDSQKLLFFPFSDVSKKTLSLEYQFRYTGQEKIGGTIDTFHLELTPKTPQNYSQIEFWIDVNGMVLQWKIKETNGDWTSVRLSNLQKNVAVNTNDFKINLPKDIKIIKSQQTDASLNSTTPSPTPVVMKTKVRKPKSKIRRRR